jgi:hypothetical protein
MPKESLITKLKLLPVQAMKALVGSRGGITSTLS